MADFPFPWLHHGPMSSDILDKCEEVFLWFTRTVTPEEREEIERGCPEPLADFMAWGDTWTYFGSAGDSYDSTLIARYAGLAEDASFEDWRDVHEDGERLDQALQHYLADLEAWLRRVDTTVPILFFYGPNTDGPDAWGDWSATQVERLWEVVKTLPPADEDADGPERHLGYIQELAAGIVADHGDPTTVIVDLYARDRAHGYVERLTWAENTVHTHGARLGPALGAKGRRAAKLGTFPPYVQLAYLASYDALDNDVLSEFRDPVEHLRGLVDALPADRADMGTPYLLLIADNLAHNTPGFTRPRKKRAGLAARVLAYAAGRPDANLDVYVNGAMYAEWAKDDRGALTLAQAGLERFGASPELLSSALSAAARLGETELAQKLAARKRTTRARPDPQALLAEGAALVQAGDFAGARKKLEAFAKRHPEARPLELLIHLTHVWCQGGPKPPASLLEDVYASLDGVMGYDPTLLGNVGVLLNQMGKHRDFLSIVDARAKKLPPSAAVWAAYTRAAVLADDAEVAKRVLGQARTRVTEDVVTAEVAENLALLHARLGQEEEARVWRARAGSLGAG